MNIEQANCYLVADFTVDPLAEMLRSDGQPPRVEVETAPFGQVGQALLDLRSGNLAVRPDVAVVWTRPEAQIPTFRALLDFERVSVETVLEEVDVFADHLLGCSVGTDCLFVPSWTLPPHQRGLGLLSMRLDTGWAHTLLRMNLRMAERLGTAPNIYQLDASRWLTSVGKKATNPKLWFLGKVAFGLEVFQEAAADIKAALRALAGLTKKLVVLDLDNTLWGGVVGEVGWEHLRLGGHDPEGEAFVAFQQALKTLTRSGVLLGLVSKNDEATALAAIDSHPEMVLRRSDFAGWRINWDDKAANIVDLVSELNLGLDSVVFIDDGPAERARVREALPQVVVPEWPVDRLLYASALQEMRWFDRPAITEEDMTRASMYVSERERSREMHAFPSMEVWLGSLNIVVAAEVLDEARITRAAQLLNRTNQMNLATRRLSEAKLLAWSREEEQRVFVFRVSDRFGDSGLTGLASLKQRGAAAEVVDFLLSCRVMGRGVEQAMLHILVEHAREHGAAVVEARYRPTPRSKPMLEFFQDRSGFQRRDDDWFAWEAGAVYPLPSYISLTISRAE